MEGPLQGIWIVPKTKFVRCRNIIHSHNGKTHYSLPYSLPVSFPDAKPTIISSKHNTQTTSNASAPTAQTMRQCFGFGVQGLGFRGYDPPYVNRRRLWVYYNKIHILST